MATEIPMRHIEMQGETSIEWRKVVFADECRPCDMCGEPYCDFCDAHYADCDCPGPHSDEDEWEFDSFFGREYARPKDPPPQRRENDA
jgi:hypothetical protein